MYRYTGFLTPLFPINIFVIFIGILSSWKKSYYYIFFFMGLLAISPTTLRYLIPLIVLPIIVMRDYRSKDKLLIIGDAILQIYAFFVSYVKNSNLFSYIVALRNWSSTGNDEIIVFHLVILVTLLSIDYFKFIRQRFGIGRFLSEDPSRPPIIYFMIILLYAALLLALGKEGAANKAAELSYYFLVLGVSIAIKNISSKDEEARDADG